MGVFHAFFGLVGDTPAVSRSVFLQHLGRCAVMLAGQRFQATIFHQITEVFQLIIIRCKTVIVADTAYLSIISSDDVLLRHVTHLRLL